MAGVPVLFTATEKAISQRGILHAGGVPPRIIYFTESYIDFCIENAGSFDGTGRLIEKMKEFGFGHSKSAISKIMAELINCGAALESYMPATDQVGRRKRFVLKDLTPLVSSFRQEYGAPQKKIIKRRLKAVHIQSIENELGDYSDLSSGSAPRMEKHFSMYDSAMKTGGHDTRSMISVEYFFGKKDSIKITAVTTTGVGDDIAHLADQRAMRVLNGFLFERIEESYRNGVEQDESLIGYISFDIADLCVAMGLHPSDTNKEIARGMLRRLASTEFRIDAENSEYYRKTMGGFDLMNYRYLTEFSAITTGDDVDGIYRRSERFYRVRIHGEIVKSLRRKDQSYLSHPGLARERNGLAHRLYNWSKAVIGVSAESKPRYYTIDNFHEKVLPVARIDNFKRDLLSLMTKFACNHGVENPAPEETATKRALIYGYYYTIFYDENLYREIAAKNGNRRRGEMVVLIERDAKDPMIGDNSDHNQAVRREIKEGKRSKLKHEHEQISRAADSGAAA